MDNSEFWLRANQKRLYIVYTLEKQIPRNIVKFTKCPTYHPLSLQETQVIDPFLSSMVSVNHYSVEEFQPIVNPYGP